MGASSVSTLNDDALQSECDRLVRAASTAALARKHAVSAKRLAAAHPDAACAQLACALIRERTRERDGMLELWTAVHTAFPSEFLALRYRIRWLVRWHRAPEAEALVDSFYAFDAKADRHELLNRGVLLTEVKNHPAADEVFEILLKTYPDDIKARTLFAQSLATRGNLAKALEVVQPIVDHPRMSAAAARFVSGLQESIAALDRLQPGRRAAGENCGSLALEAALGLFKKRTRRELTPGRLGQVAFVTGGLGAGGAERQMSRTVVRLERLRRRNVPVEGVVLDGPFEVVVKSHTGDHGNDFFLDYVRRAGVKTVQINDMPTAPLSRVATKSKTLKALIPILPSNVRYGVQRLVRYFRDRQTDVVYLWQDGAVLFGVLAALMAGVPRIVLCLRGLPPVTRLHRFRPEYEGLYRALLTMPGVYFVANSRSVASAYSDWLAVDVSRFTVIYNGVHKLTSQPNGSGEEETWAAFEERTQDANLTVGSVFRFDVDKRPALWLRAAQHYLKAHPRTRYVLVGDGVMLEEARVRADKYGIAERILFVGRSNNVGYWLARMDLFLLLSRYEGLPNVLVEAQLAGLGVVSTPAGGAAEVYVEGVTGFGLTCAEKPELEQIVEKLNLMAERLASHPDTPSIAHRTASSKFSVRTMLDSTVAALTERSVAQEGRTDA